MRISDWSSDVCSSDLWCAPTSSSPAKRESIMPNPLLAPLMRWFGRLSYPKLFLLTAALFVGDVLVPDMIPFVDELLLGLGTLLLANWKRVRPRRGRSEEHTSELQSLMRTSYAVFCLKQKKTENIQH